MNLVVEQVGGMCPLEAEGTIDGVPFYFRARGNRWQMHIGGEDIFLKPDWYRTDDWGTGPFEAGYMDPIEGLWFVYCLALDYTSLAERIARKKAEIESQVDLSHWSTYRDRE